MKFRLIHADVLDGLRSLADESVQCVITSPPYWSLRDYGVAGQIGLERTPDEYVARMVAVFREVRRVLRDDATLWLNIGDSYCAAPNGNKPGDYSTSSLTNPWRQDLTTPRVKDAKSKQATNRAADLGAAPHRTKLDGIKPKDLVGIPWMLAFALRADGWYLRSDIIWAKPNPMPESVTDRPTKAHEYLFLLSKSARYYYDPDAIKEAAAYAQPNSPDSIKSPYGQGFTRRAAPGPGISGWARGSGSHSAVEHNRHGRPKGESRPLGGKLDAATKDNRATASARMGRGAGFRDEDGTQPLTRNKRSVWTIATEPFPEAHFATFPTALVEPCVLAGSRTHDTILDPFSGSGTTGVVALSHQRDYVGIELNAEYVEMSRRRLASVAPLLAHEETALSATGAEAARIGLPLAPATEQQTSDLAGAQEENGTEAVSS